MELIAGSYKFLTLSVNPVAKKPFKIEAKMVERVPGDASGRQNMLNLLVNLSVILARPPDGGAAQAMTVESCTDFQDQSATSSGLITGGSSYLPTTT